MSITAGLYYKTDFTVNAVVYKTYYYITDQGALLWNLIIGLFDGDAIPISFLVRDVSRPTCICHIYLFCNNLDACSLYH